jgi:hypothetical protein
VNPGADQELLDPFQASAEEKQHPGGEDGGHEAGTGPVLIHDPPVVVGGKQQLVVAENPAGAQQEEALLAQQPREVVRCAWHQPDGFMLLEGAFDQVVPAVRDDTGERQPLQQAVQRREVLARVPPGEDAAQMV